MAKKLVSKCPVCDGELSISRLSCGACDTHIESRLPIPAVFRLPDELQQFVLIFLGCRGNIREVEKVLGVSYPTVCKKLDQVNEALQGKTPAPDRDHVLRQLERGEITAREAAHRLKRG